MPLYDGTPSIKLEGDKALALAQIPNAKLLLAKTQSVAKNAGIATFGMTQRTEEGYIYALTANGVNRVLISANPVGVDEVTPEEPLVITTHGFPDMLSGTVIEGTVTAGKLVNFAPTAACRAVHKTLAAGLQPSSRLAVDPWIENSEVAPSDAYTQYARLKAGMYTGRMCQVVQAVMGLGRIDISKIADKAINKQSSTLAKYLREVRAYGVQVRYDYKFHRTHGIYTGPDGVLWLVEIGVSRGVVARPLPIIPGSDKPAFRQSAEIRGDADVLAVLDELGCFPSGETFPVLKKDFDKAVARGDILQLLPASGLRDFYKWAPYSTVLGWAFGRNGDEAHNTCYGFEDGNINQTGFHYQVNISIGPVNTARQPGTPVSTGSANLIIQSKGTLWGTGKKTKYLPFKVHEPLVGGLMSHDASPMSGGIPPFCDTTVFVCFDENQLKVVKFYLNPEVDTTPKVEDPRYPGECILNGEWTITETNGERFPRMMYSNDFDDREVLKDDIAVTHIVSKDLGFDPPQFGDFIEAPAFCFIRRNRVFERTTTYTRRFNTFVASVVCIPEFSRSAYYYMLYRSEGAGVWNEERVYDYIKDPNQGYGWRRIVTVGVPPIAQDCVDHRFDCGTTHTDRRVICITYEPDLNLGHLGVDGECYQYADHGQWLEMCQNIESLCSAQTNGSFPARTGYFRSGVTQAKTKQTLTLMSPGYGGPLEIVTPFDSYPLWADPSPDPDTGFVQGISSTHSCLGEDAIVYMEDLAGVGEQKTKGVGAVTIGPSDNANYIGVNGNG